MRHHFCCEGCAVRIADLVSRSPVSEGRRGTTLVGELADEVWCFGQWDGRAGAVQGGREACVGLLEKKAVPAYEALDDRGRTGLGERSWKRSKGKMGKCGFVPLGEFAKAYS